MSALKLFRKENKSIKINYTDFRPDRKFKMAAKERLKKNWFQIYWILIYKLKKLYGNFNQFLTQSEIQEIQSFYYWADKDKEHIYRNYVMTSLC